MAGSCQNATLDRMDGSDAVSAGMVVRMQKGGVMLVLAFSAALTWAQTSAAPEGTVEITAKSVNDIPVQYRASTRKSRKPFAVRFSCPDAGRLYVIFDNAQQTATVEAGNTIRYLKQAVSADGGRYTNSDGSYVFWVKGKQATINGSEVCEVD